MSYGGYSQVGWVWVGSESRMKLERTRRRMINLGFPVNNGRRKAQQDQIGALHDGASMQKEEHVSTLIRIERWWSGCQGD